MSLLLVPRGAVTIPTYIKPIFSLRNIKTETHQATLCGVNTKIETYIVSEKSLALSISNMVILINIIL